MPRLTPLNPLEIPASSKSGFDQAAASMGFQANDVLTMARHPDLLNSFGQLVATLYRPSKVSLRIKRLVGYMTSNAAGCTYCSAHTAHSALQLGIDEATMDAIWDYESTTLFDERERAALRIAHHAALVPNGVTDQMYAEFARCFAPDEQVEIVGIISLFGFLNRWNSTLATDIESVPNGSYAKLKYPAR